MSVLLAFTLIVFQNFFRGTEENYKNPQPKLTVFMPRFEPVTSGQNQ